MPGSEPADVAATQQPARPTACAAAGRAPCPPRRAPRRPRVEWSTASRGHREDVGRRGQEGQRHVVARGLEPRGELVDGGRDAGCSWPRRRRRSCPARACPAGRCSQSATAGTPVSRSAPAPRRGPRARRRRGDQRAGAVVGQRSASASRSRAAARSTAATRAPQRSSDGSGPISAPAPSTATVRPSSRSQSGLSSTASTASATVGSTTPASTHVVDPARMPGAAEPFAAVGQHQLGHGSARCRPPRRPPGHRCPGRRRPHRRPGPATERASPPGGGPVGVGDPHALVQRVQPVARDGTASSGVLSPASTSAPEVGQVVAAPRRRLLGGPGPGRVDAPQGVGHDGRPPSTCSASSASAGKTSPRCSSLATATSCRTPCHVQHVDTTLLGRELGGAGASEDSPPREGLMPSAHVTAGPRPAQPPTSNPPRHDRSRQPPAGGHDAVDDPRERRAQGAAAGQQPGAKSGTVQVVHVDARTPALRTEVTQLGLDVTEHGDASGLDVVLHGKKDAARLREAGFGWTVRIPDLEARFKANAAQGQGVRRRERRRIAAAERPHVVPHPGRRQRRVGAPAWRYPQPRAAAHAVEPVVEGRTSVRHRDHHAGRDLARRQAGLPEHGGPPRSGVAVGRAPMEFAYDLLENDRHRRARTRIVEETRTIIVPW